VSAETRLETREECTQHNTHYPRSHLNHRHHVWPLGMGGPATEDNIVVICPTGHANVHELLKAYIEFHGQVPYAIRRQYPRGERRLAQLGYERFIRRAM